MPRAQDRAEQHEGDQMVAHFDHPGLQLIREQFVRQARRRHKAEPQEETDHGSGAERCTSRRHAPHGIDQQSHEDGLYQ